MRKHLLIISAFFTVLATPAVALASVDSVAPTTMPGITAAPEMQTLSSTRMEARDAMKTKMMQAREEFKAKMSALKDQRKINKLTNFDTKINEINKRRTAEMTERIARLTIILGNVSTKEAALKTAGKDTTTVATNIKAASTALTAATTAINAQAAKDYVVTITTPTALKNAASTTIQQFVADMKLTRQAVIDAQAAVRKAHTSLVQLTVGVTPTVTATP